MSLVGRPSDEAPFPVLWFWSQNDLSFSVERQGLQAKATSSLSLSAISGDKNNILRSNITLLRPTDEHATRLWHRCVPPMEPPKADREDDVPPGDPGVPPVAGGADPGSGEGAPMYRRRGRLEPSAPVEDAVPLRGLPSCSSKTRRCEARLEMGVNLRIAKRTPQPRTGREGKRKKKKRSARPEALAQIAARVSLLG